MKRVVGLAVLACAAAFASSGDGDIAGLIQDSTGGAIPSASVTLMDENTGIRRKTVTDGEGAYDMPGLPAGKYKMIIRQPGFQTIVRWNVVVEPDRITRLDFVMKVGSMRETITIEGGPSPVNTTDGSVGVLFNRDHIQNLPINGRGVMSLVELSPGIVTTPAASGEAGQFSTNGLRANTNYFSVDGLSANTSVTGAGLPAQFAGAALPSMTAFGSTQNLAPTEALEEVRILTSSFAPQFGRLPGAQVALTTRAGSTEYHGSAWYSLRNEALDANDWFANAHANRRAPLRLNHWGAALSGPLYRQRTFFFATYEGLRLVQPYNATLVTPSLEARSAAPAELRPVLDAFPTPNGASPLAGVAERVAQFSRPSRLDAVSLRIDHALTERVSLFGRYNRAPSYTRSGFGHIEDFHLNTSSLTLGASVMARPSVTNDARMNVWNTNAASDWRLNPAAGGAPFDFSQILRTPDHQDAVFYGIAIGGVGALYSGPAGRNRQRQWNFVDTLAINHERHDLRLGVDYQRLATARDSAAVSVTGAWNSLSDVLAGAPPVTAVLRAEPASALMETLSAYAQDTWHVSPRLTLTYGVRWEVTPPPAVREPGAAGAVFPSTPGVSTFAGATDLPYLPVASVNAPLWRTRYTQFAPRAGAALRADESSVVRAGVGIFYDVGLSAALDPINGFPFNRWQFGSSSMAFLSDGPAFGARVAPELELPYALEWNIAYERMFGLRDVASISYVGSAGRNLLRYEGVLQPGSRFAQFAVATNHGRSSYHGLQLQYRRRLSRGLRGTASYTWSHSIDNGSWDSGLYLVDEDLSAASDRGSSAFDVRHNFSAGLSYDVPAMGPSGVRPVSRGWQLSGIFRARSGFPFDVLTSSNFLGLAFDNITRPDLVPGVPVWISGGAIGGRRLNPAAFSVPRGIQGNLGRNAIRGFGMSQLDLSLQRAFPIRSEASLELRVEAYNVLNHPNGADPVRFMDNPFFGSPISMLNLMLGSGTARSGITPAFQIGGPRSLQVTLRLRF